MGKINVKEWSGSARKRLYLSLPYVASLLALYGVMEGNKLSMWLGLAGVFLGPIQGHVAAAHVPPDDDLSKPDQGE